MRIEKVKRQVIDLVPVGAWLASFEAVWSSPCNPGTHECCLKHGCMDNEPDRVSDVDASVTRVTRSNYLKFDVIGRDLDWNTSDSYDDTHDLRPRLFATKREAEEHVKATIDKFKNPMPWQSFVKVA